MQSLLEVFLTLLPRLCIGGNAFTTPIVQEVRPPPGTPSVRAGQRGFSLSRVLSFDEEGVRPPEYPIHRFSRPVHEVFCQTVRQI